MTEIKTHLPFATYDAFTNVPYSGSQAAVVLEAAGLPRVARAHIAREIGMPATCFVDCIDGSSITCQFFSTVMELPMCGHGTLCLVTRLVDIGALPLEGDKWHMAELDLPGGIATVEYRRVLEGRVQVMLDVAAATFTPAQIDLGELATCLGVTKAAFSPDRKVEVATADFIHLCLPMRDLSAIGALKPDFAALRDYCAANGLETIAAFTTEVEDPDCQLHVRDFCPAVGVAESAAAGTTNAALAAYALRNGLMQPDASGIVELRAEQGHELGRPSRITSKLTLEGGKIARLQVGGIASKVIDGSLST